jgi:hypothetical protein
MRCLLSVLALSQKEVTKDFFTGKCNASFYGLHACTYKDVQCEAIMNMLYIGNGQCRQQCKATCRY